MFLSYCKAVVNICAVTLADTLLGFSEPTNEGTVNRRWGYLAESRTQELFVIWLRGPTHADMEQRISHRVFLRRSTLAVISDLPRQLQTGRFIRHIQRTFLCIMTRKQREAIRNLMSLFLERVGRRKI